MVDQQFGGAEDVEVVDRGIMRHIHCRHKFAMNNVNFN